MDGMLLPLDSKSDLFCRIKYNITINRINYTNGPYGYGNLCVCSLTYFLNSNRPYNVILLCV